MPTDPLHPNVPAPAQFDPKDWLWTVGARKGVTVGAKALASWLVAHKYAAVAAKVLSALGIFLGVPVAPDPSLIEAGLAAVGVSGLTVIRNWLKLKTAFGAKYL